MELSITVTGVTETLTALTRFDAACADLRPAFERVVPIVPQMVADTFAAQGPGWRPLSPGYAAWKAAHFPGQPLLVRSGEGKAAATRPDGWETKFAPDRLTMTYRGPAYMAYHQQGGGRLPQRQWLVVTPAYQERMVRAMEQALVEEAARLGLGPAVA